jgi:lysozyme
MIPDSLMRQIMADLTEDEGFRSKPYLCPAGKLTIGIGRNLEAKGISRAEALILLRNDIVDSHLALREHLPEIEYLLSDNQYRVVLEMVFNLGIAGFLKFKKFIQAIMDHSFQVAADEILDSDLSKPRAERWAQIFREG